MTALIAAARGGDELMAAANPDAGGPELEVAPLAGDRGVWGFLWRGTARVGTGRGQRARDFCVGIAS